MVGGAVPEALRVGPAPRGYIHAEHHYPTPPPPGPLRAQQVTNGCFHAVPICVSGSLPPGAEIPEDEEKCGLWPPIPATVTVCAPSVYISGSQSGFLTQQPELCPGSCSAYDPETVWPTVCLTRPPGARCSLRLQKPWDRPGDPRRRGPLLPPSPHPDSSRSPPSPC